MIEHDFDINTQIGGWYMPKKICNDIIDYIDNADLHEGRMYIDGVQTIDHKKKEGVEKLLTHGMKMNLGIHTKNIYIKC